MAAIPSRTSTVGCFRISVLGPFRVARDGQTLDTARWQRKVETLFKLLVIAPNHRRLKDEVVDMLWPETGPDAGSGNLRIVVHRLRLALGGGDPSPVISAQGWILLNEAYDWEVDLDRFSSLVTMESAGLEELYQAAALHRGEALPEDRYDDWSMPTRDRARRAWRDLCLRLGEECTRRGDLEAAAEWFERSLADDPLDEVALRGVLGALMRAGRRTDALRRYGEFERRLQQDLGVPPSPETVALAQTLATPSMPVPVPAPALAASLEAEAIDSATPAQPGVEAGSLRRRTVVLAVVAVVVLAAAVVAGFVARAGTATRGSPASTSPSGVIRMWGSAGTLVGRLEGPTGLGLDRAGHLWVADFGNGRIEEYSSSGTLLAWTGSQGIGPGQFQEPSDVAVDAAGTVYVAEGGNRRIQVLSRALVPLNMLQYFPPGSTESTSLTSVSVDASGRVYATDYSRSRVRVFSPDGKLLRSWGRKGHLAGEFNSPDGIAVDSRNRVVYVSDKFNNRIEKFTLTGGFLRAWGRDGAAPGELDRPADLAVDRNGNVYVADTGNSRVQEFTPSGRLLVTWGSKGRGYLQFNQPSGIAVDSRGVIYVTDFFNNRIEKIVPSGARP